MNFGTIQKNFTSTSFMFLKISSVYLFSAALYKLILVSHKDVLFHLENCRTQKNYKLQKNVKVNKKLATDRKTFISKKDLFGGTFTINFFTHAIGQNILKPMQENCCP